MVYLPCCYQTSITGGLSGLILAWVNELNSHDNESTIFYSSLYCKTYEDYTQSVHSL